MSLCSQHALIEPLTMHSVSGSVVAILSSHKTKDTWVVVVALQKLLSVDGPSHRRDVVAITGHRSSEYGNVTMGDGMVSIRRRR